MGKNINSVLNAFIIKTENLVKIIFASLETCLYEKHVNAYIPFLFDHLIMENFISCNLTQRTTAGQLLAQENGVYLTLQGVVPDTAHSLTAAQGASPQIVTAVSQSTVSCCM
jgi:hypothetical protein